MSTLVMTVPHSGTNFLVRFLGAVLGLNGRNGVGNPDIGFVTQGTNCDFCQIHPRRKAIESWKPYVLEEHFDSVIITLRHPYLTLTSSKRRGRTFDTYGDDASSETEQCKDSWTTLIEEFQKYTTALTLTIDGPKENRLPELLAIARHFGKEDMIAPITKYANDWLPVNQSITEYDIQQLGDAVKAYEQWQS